MTLTHHPVETNMPRMTKAEKAEVKAATDARIAEAVAVVRSGRCPLCGAGLVYNNAITGWYQCVAYGTPGFRGGYSGRSKMTVEERAALDARAGCSFQCFTQ